MLLWSALEALATAPQTIPFSALAQTWNLLPEHFPSIQTILAAHGWTVVADAPTTTPAGPTIPPAPSVWEEPLRPGPFYAEALTANDPPTFVPELLAWVHLIPREARYYASPSFPYEDALQEGVFGLTDALGRYDPDRRIAFPRFARSYIRRAIQRAARNYAPVRISRRLLELQSRVEQARWILTPSLGHVPSSAELATWLRLPVEQVDTILALEPAVDSLDRPRFAENALPWVETLADPTAADFTVPTDPLPTLSEADALQWLLTHGFSLETLAATTHRSVESLATLAADWLPSVS